MAALLQIVGRPDIGQSAWDQLADTAGDAWLWHRWDLIDAVACWHGRTDMSFAVTETSGEPVALVPLYRCAFKALRMITFIELDGLGGPALVGRPSANQRRRIMDTIAQHLCRETLRYKAVGCSVKFNPLAPNLRGAACPRVNPLLDLGLDNAQSQSWLVDLSKGREAVWDGMEGRARTNVRKAEKDGVTVRLAKPGEDDLQAYYALHQQTYGRTGAATHPKAYFQAIFEKFLAAGLGLILFAEQAGTVIAAASFGLYKNAGHYWTGAASPDGLRSGANSLLQWTAMTMMIERGALWFESGEAFPHKSAGKERALSDFKKSFGGEIYPYFKGTLPSANGLFDLLRTVKRMPENRRALSQRIGA